MAVVLNRRILGSYAGVTLPMAAMAMPITVYLPPFYSAGLGLDLAVVGLIFTLARVSDVITDPIMGVLIDKYDTRWGRRKHWIALAIPILLLSVYMVFLPDPDWVSPMYLGFWLVMLYIGFTMMAIAHQSWGAELATSYDDRSRLFAWREIFVLAGMTTVLAIPAFVELMDQGDTAAKVASMGWFCLIAFPITVIPTLLFVPDTSKATAMTVDWVEAVKVMVKNTTMWRLLFLDFTTGLCFSASGVTYIFVATYVFELPSHASFALLLFFLSSFMFMPLWLKAAYLYGKDKTTRIALIYAVVIQVSLFFFAEPGAVWVLWGYTLLFGIAYGAPPTLIRSMMADVTDVDELQTGTKRAGLFFAVLTTTGKLGSAIAVGLTFAFVEIFFGFTPGDEVTQEGVDGLLITYIAIPASMLLLSILPMIGYPLSKEKHAEVSRQLQLKQAAA